MPSVSTILRLPTENPHGEMTYREMVILGWTPARAMSYKRQTNYDSVKRRLTIIRAELRKQGWDFSNPHIPKPPNAPSAI